jgi:uncharacterized membrane protein (DUF485 family)
MYGDHVFNCFSSAILPSVCDESNKFARGGNKKAGKCERAGGLRGETAHPKNATLCPQPGCCECSPRFPYSNPQKGFHVAHFDLKSSPSLETESAVDAARNARIGLVLFALYLAFYAAFVILTAFAAEWMQTEIAGVNVAIYSGFGLIAGAFLMALVYLWLCRSNVNR